MAGGRRASHSLGSGVRDAVQRRQIDYKRRALIDLRLDLEKAAVALHDPQHGCQAEAGALAGFFGREERLKNLVEDFTRDARPAIFDGDDHIKTRFRAGRVILLVRLDHRVFRRDTQSAAVGHGIAGINSKIDHHLMELGRIAHDRPEVLGNLGFKLDGLGKSVVNDPDDFLEQMAGLQKHAFTLDTACESQDLLDHVRPAFSAGFQNSEHALALIVAELLAQNLHGHQNRGEHVIEVVGNAAGERADAFHALSAEELGLDFSLLANIGIDHEDGFSAPGIIEDERPLALDDNRLIALRDVAGLALPLAFFHDLLLCAVEIGAVAEKQFVRQLAASVFSRPAVKALGAFV